MKNFFVNYRRRFNLEEVLQEWEAEQGTQESNGISPTAGEERKPTVNSLASKSPDVDEKSPSPPVAASAPPTPVAIAVTCVASLNQPPPLLRPVLPAAPALHRQPPPLQQQTRFLQPRPTLNQPPPPLIRPTNPIPPRLNPRPVLQQPPSLIGIQSESQSSSLH